MTLIELPRPLRRTPPSPYGGRVPRSAHTTQPWRIHEIAHDFEIEDVWALPILGGRDDLARLVDKIAGSGPPEEGSSAVGRLLWAARWKLGEWFGWDDEDTGIGIRVASLRERMPTDLRDAATGPELPDAPFTSLYLLRDEWAAEIANSTVHGVLHLGWIDDGGGCYRAQMAVLVKPNGLLGRLYLLAIKPFRYLFIYPALLRRFERDWTDAA